MTPDESIRTWWPWLPAQFLVLMLSIASLITLVGYAIQHRIVIRRLAKSVVFLPRPRATEHDGENCFFSHKDFQYRLTVRGDSSIVEIDQTM